MGVGSSININGPKTAIVWSGPGVRIRMLDNLRVIESVAKIAITICKIAQWLMSSNRERGVQKHPHRKSRSESKSILSEWL